MSPAVVAGLVLALAALGIAAELAARAWIARYGRYYVWPPHARLHLSTDREAVPELEPLVRVEFNSEGERGGPPPREWHDAFRVLVAGGSSAECWFLDQPSTWPQVIQRTLNEAENLRKLGVSRVHVGSIARSLVACEHVDKMVERVLPRHERLDVVVLMVGASDLVHWLEKGTPTRIERDDIPLESMFSEHPEGPFGWSRSTLALKHLASACRRNVFRPIARRKNVGRRIAQARVARAQATEILHDVPDPRRMLDRLEKNLRSLLVHSLAHAKRVIVARQPWLEKEFTPEEEKQLWMFGVGRIHSEPVTTYYAHDLVWKLMRQVDACIARVAADLGVESVDLRPVVPPTFELWYDEMHHNARGCEKIGRALARVILRET